MKLACLMKSTAMGVFLLTFIACSHGPKVQEFPGEANATDEVRSLETDLNATFENQYDVLAPNQYAKAREALEDAKKEKDSGDILHEVAVGRAYLGQARATVNLANTNMEPVVKARADALTAGAPHFMRSDFEVADRRLKEVTEDLEKNKIDSAKKERESLQAQYIDLEIKAMKHSNLDQAKSKIELAIKEGAREYAPKTLAMTEKSVGDTDAYITSNRQEASEIRSRARSANESADHLLQMTRESKLTKKSSPEEIAMRADLNRKETAMKEAELASKKKELSAEERESQRLGSEKDAIQAQHESEQAFAKIFDDAQAEFSSDEAEVYKQGDSLLIRLKGLGFPSSKSTLSGAKNAGLLSKVQKVIRETPVSSVVIEGHTDSIGGKAVNEKLSQNRAQAVREYLISNDAISQEKISAVGYGDQRPLSTNKTAQGRSENRRVDVVIKPEKTGNL